MGDTPAEADNVRVTGLAALLPPSCAFEELPGDGEIYNLCVETREQILADKTIGEEDLRSGFVLHGSLPDPGDFGIDVAGPVSIHDHPLRSRRQASLTAG